jgi:hypothetical protein
MILLRDPASKAILEELQLLKRDIAKLSGERDAVREELKLGDEVTRLKRTLTNLEIERDKIIEEHEREKREVEHHVGLERKRMEFEIDSAKRDTTLTVREENLSAQIERFEEQMKFRTERFDMEVGYLKELMGEILERLPHVEVDKKIAIGAAVSENGDDDE